MDSTLSFQDHAKKVAGTSFGLLRGLKTLLVFLDPSTRQIIVQAPILSRLDYVSSL